jgi:DNA-directed RNA polymerase, mitochondrial
MAWITPLNLPVIQPYRRQARYAVKTVLQRVVLAMNSDFLPVESRKQKSAFPPNFVHSLDATHMLLTSLRMKEKNLQFAAVHDSFWTHPCDALQLSKVTMAD